MGKITNCSECNRSKDALKREIIEEIMPLLCSCMGVGGNGRHCRRARSEGTPHPIELRQIVPLCGVLPKYADSAGILGKELKELQQQIDHNFAEISFAKQVYDREVNYLLKMSSYLEHTTDMLHKEVGDTKVVYDRELDFVLSSNDHLYSIANELSSELTESREANIELKMEMEKLSTTIEKVQMEVEAVEMYGRRNIFEIDGIKEDPQEDTNKIALKVIHDLGLKNVTFKDICRSHRMYRRRKNKHLPRPIYVKLVNHDLKDEVIKRRNMLREMPQYRRVFIDENLTKSRRQLFNKVRHEVGNEHCYTNDGTIYVKLYNANSQKSFTRKINNKKDFINVFDKEPRGK